MVNASKRLVQLVLLVAAFCGASVPAQVRIDDAVASLFLTNDGVVVAYHESGCITASIFDEELGTLVQASTHATAGDPVPTLTTSWCDANGVSHSVSTPIQATSDAGIAKAVRAHDALVALLQAAHPPRPCPKPTPAPVVQ